MLVIRIWSRAESSQKKVDEQDHPPLPIAIFSVPFQEVITGYSEPLEMSSILIEKKIDQHFLKPLKKQSAEQTGPDWELWQIKIDL